MAEDNRGAGGDNGEVGIVSFFIGVVVVGVTLLGTFFLVNQNVNERFDAVSENVRSVDQTVTGRLDNIINSVGQRFDSMNQNINQRFDAQAQNTNMRFNTVDARLESIGETVSVLNGETDQLIKETERLARDTERLIAETDRLVDEVRSVKEELIVGQAIRNRLNEVGDKLDEITDWCEQTDQRLGFLEEIDKSSEESQSR